MNLFDPLSIIIKLSLINKKYIGTKISIKNYIMIIQKPSLYQCIIRYFNSDNKFDIVNIIIPIYIACNIYLTNNYFLNMIKIFEMAQSGILILSETYKKYPIIISILNYAYLIINIYINNLKSNKILHKSLSIDSIFSDTISNTSNNKTLHKCSSKDSIFSNNTLSKSNSTSSIVYRYSSTGYFSFMESSTEELNEENNNFNINNFLINKLENYYTDKLINNFKLLWTEDNINYILTYLNTNNLLIENFMINIDNKVVNILLNYYFYL